MHTQLQGEIELFVAGHPKACQERPSSTYIDPGTQHVVGPGDLPVARMELGPADRTHALRRNALIPINTLYVGRGSA